MEKDHQISVLIADDHSLIRQGIVSLLNETEDIKVIGEAADGEELIKLNDQLKPDVALVDICMPVMSGPEAVQTIFNSGGKIKALFISIYNDEESKYSCLKAGGMGLIDKNACITHLIQTIKLIYSGSYYFGEESDEENTQFAKNFDGYKRFTRHVNINVLSRREKEIVILISQGLTSSQIAEKLFLSKRTIDSYRCNILRKLRLKTFTELMKYAVRQHPDKYF